MVSRHLWQVTNFRRVVRPPMPGGAPQSARSSLDRRACTHSIGVGSSRGGSGGSKRGGRTIGHTEHLSSHRQRVEFGREELRPMLGASRRLRVVVLAVRGAAVLGVR